MNKRLVEYNLPLADISTACLVSTVSAREQIQLFGSTLLTTTGKKKHGPRQT